MMTYTQAQVVIDFVLDHSDDIEDACDNQEFNIAVDSLCRLCQIGAAVFHRALERPGEPQHKGDA